VKSWITCIRPSCINTLKILGIFVSIKSIGMISYFQTKEKIPRKVSTLNCLSLACHSWHTQCLLKGRIHSHICNRLLVVSSLSLYLLCQIWETGLLIWLSNNTDKPISMILVIDFKFLRLKRSITINQKLAPT
jgi:hypothetical protein